MCIDRRIHLPRAVPALQPRQGSSPCKNLLMAAPQDDFGQVAPGNAHRRSSPRTAAMMHLVWGTTPKGPAGKRSLPYRSCWTSSVLGPACQPNIVKIQMSDKAALEHFASGSYGEEVAWQLHAATGLRQASRAVQDQIQDQAHQVQAAKGALGACSCGPASGGCACADPVRVVCSSRHQLRLCHTRPTHLCRRNEDVTAVVAVSHTFSARCSCPGICCVASLHEPLALASLAQLTRRICAKEAVIVPPPRWRNSAEGCGAWFVTAAEAAALRLRPSGSFPTWCSMPHTASCMSVQLGLLLSCMPD